ncbi:MAG: ABC transporter permease [Eubacteriales bacterium]|nr:ABC transporter permease [Eubacteriales bacterium]
MDLQILFNSLPGAISQGLIWGIAGIGVYISYKILDIADMTCDGIFATGGATCIMLMLSGHSIAFSLIMSFIVGMLGGLVTALLQTLLGIPAILSGILTQLALYSINLKIMGGKANLPINSNNYNLLVSLRNVKSLNILNNTIFISLIITAIIIIIFYWFFGTEFGCTIRATGKNPDMCKAQGININTNKIIGLVLSNGTIAFSGALLSQYQGFADVQMGRGAIVIGLAAIVIGEALFKSIFKNFGLKLLGVSIGSIIYYLVLQLVIWRGLDPTMLKLFSAIIVAVFLSIPYIKNNIHQNLQIKHSHNKHNVDITKEEN